MASSETLQSNDTRKETMETIRESANEIIERGHIPVITEKSDEVLAPSRNPHDYASLTFYTMLRTDGGDMDFRDGTHNPDREKYTDSKRMEEARMNLFFTSNAAIEAQANGQLEEAQKYVTYAENTLKAWFVDEETRMTPNLEFAHMIKGEESGNFFGIIEGDDLLTFIDEATRLKDAGLLSSTTGEGISQWFEEYLQWLTTSEKGLREKEMKNNHGAFYDAQVAKIADFLDKEDLVIETLERAKTRINSQITELGAMPLEAERVDSYGYQLYNLYGYSKLATIGEKYGIDLWNYEAPSGGSLKKAFEHFVTILPDSSSNPISEERGGQLYITLRAAAKAYKNKDYFDIPTTYFPNNPLADEITKDMFGTSEEIIDESQSQEKSKPEIMDFSPEIEDSFVEKAKTGIDKFVAEGGGIILFDWDGTIRGNNFEQGVSNYIRRGFVETYQYAKAQGLRVGVCSLRSTEEIESLEHLGITLDEYNGADTMRAFIEEHPSIFHEASQEFQKLTREEMVSAATELFAKIKDGERPEGWEVILQASGEMQANNQQYPNIKNLFMAHKLSAGEKVFLIDDDEASGGTAERFGVGVQIPRPAGYKHDNKTLS